MAGCLRHVVFFMVHVFLHVFGYLLPRGLAMLASFISCRRCRHKPSDYIYHPKTELRVIYNHDDLEACKDVFGLVDVKSSVLEDRQYCCDTEEERKALKEAARQCMLEYDAPQYNGHIGTIMGAMRVSHRVPYKREAMVAWDGCPVMLDWLYVDGDLPLHTISEEELQQRPTSNGGSSTSTTDPPRGKGVCLIFPGLSSHSQSNYVQSMVRTLHRGGYHCCVYNTRGMGDTPLTRNFMFNGAYTRDARDCIRTYFTDAALRRRFGRTMPVVGIGLSLGGVTLSKYLGEEGREGGDPCLDAAITCCSPNDFTRMVEHMNRGSYQKGLYQRDMCNDIRNYFLRHQALQELPNVDNDYVFKQGNIHRFTRVIHFDQHLIAKSAGYRSIHHYHLDSSAVMWAPYTPVPLLVISTMDDPVIGRTVMPYRWQEIVENNPRVAYVESRVGGHLGFLGGPIDEARGRSNWMERFVLQRVEAVTACWIRNRDAEEEAQRCSMLSPLKGGEAFPKTEVPPPAEPSNEGSSNSLTGSDAHWSRQASDHEPVPHSSSDIVAVFVGGGSMEVFKVDQEPVAPVRRNNHQYFTAVTLPVIPAQGLGQQYFAPLDAPRPTPVVAVSPDTVCLTPGVDQRPFSPVSTNCDYYVDPRILMLADAGNNRGAQLDTSMQLV